MRRLPTIALAGILLVAPALAGCSVENVLEQATGGNVDLGGAAVPDDFPADIPLYDGEVLSGIGLGSGDGKVWNVGVRVPDAAALDIIAQQLTDAGFDTKLSGSPTDDGGALVSGSPAYGVLVAVVRDDGGFVANYSVSAGPQ